jgi:hypothetical protein
MTVGPFWRYYGGKWRAAPRYPAPEFDTIVEPFAGAAGYSCRYPSRRVILVDKSPIICGIWRYLIAATPAEILALPDIPEGGTVDDIDVCQEARWLAGFWCNEGAVAPRKSPSKWARDDRAVHGSQWGGWCEQSRAKIAMGVARIDHWHVFQGEYFEVADIEATWFVDPPYQTKAGSYYPEQPDSHQALGEWCLSRRGQVIACDQVGADWLPWNARFDLKSGDNSKKVSREVVYHRSRHPSLFGGAT